jgi:lipoprotein-releasing system permease protein
MIIAVALVNGFKATIEGKMFVFWGHFHVVPFNPNPASIISPNPINKDEQLIRQIASVQGVTDVQPFAVKPAILNADGTIEGVKLKGVEPGYSFKSNESILFSGTPIDFSDTVYSRGIILSTFTANRLQVKVQDSVLVYFVDPEQDFPRIRRLLVAGTYATGVEEVDRSFALCDIRLIRRISNWSDTAINGYQVSVDNYQNAHAIAEETNREYLVPPITRETMDDIYPNIFSWLEAQNINTRVLLIIMVIVAVINIATALLIFILERTNMIGTLKAMGMSNAKIQAVFVYHSLYVSLRGILWGTAIAVLLIIVQHYTHLIPMDEQTYSVSFAPVSIAWWEIALIDIGTFAFCLLLMTIPSLMARKINIINAIRFK